MTRSIRAAAIAAASLIGISEPGTARSLHAQTVHYSVSTSYATGSYIFSGSAWSAAMFHGVRVQGGRFSFSATLPIVAQNNTALTYIGGVLVPTGGPDDSAVAMRRRGQPVEWGQGTGGMRSGSGGPGSGSGSGSGSGNGSSSGFGGHGNVASGPVLATTTADTLTVTEPGGTNVNVGDPFFSGTVELYQGLGFVRSLSVQAYAKAPIAPVSSGVSTGKWDFGGGASVALASGRTFFYGDASYWVLGDMPALELLDNVVYGVGVGRSSFDGRWSLAASASGSSEVIRNVTPPASAGLSLAYRQSALQSFTLGANAGLTESASKFSVSLGWRVQLFGRP